MSGNRQPWRRQKILINRLQLHVAVLAVARRGHIGTGKGVMVMVLCSRCSTFKLQRSILIGDGWCSTRFRQLCRACAFKGKNIQKISPAKGLPVSLYGRGREHKAR